MDQPNESVPEATDAGLLNDLQRNSLRITLRLAEEALQDASRHLDEAPYEGILHGMADDLTPHQKEAITAEMGRAREILRSLRARFGLSPEVHEKSRLVLGKVIPAWEMVMEGRTPHLEGYGPVAPGLAEVLDPSIERLGESFVRIEALARGDRRRLTGAKDRT